jgi:hypothetical protein
MKKLKIFFLILMISGTTFLSSCLVPGPGHGSPGGGKPYHGQPKPHGNNGHHDHDDHHDN